VLYSPSTISRWSVLSNKEAAFSALRASTVVATSQKPLYDQLSNATNSSNDICPLHDNIVPYVVVLIGKTVSCLHQLHLTDFLR
jgi:hypothetical protein